MLQWARASQFFLLLMAGALPSLTGCGIPAAPQPPTLYLSQPASDLSATRIGNDVQLRWTMPKRSTDKMPLKGNQEAHVCRHLENGPCVAAGNVAFAPEAPASFTDHLPAALTSGEPRLITYTVELLNHRGRTAGASNLAFSAAGTAPVQVAAFAAKQHADGVLLRWQSAQDASTLLRIERTLVPKPGEPSKPGSSTMLQGAEVPPQRTLEVPFTGHHDPGNAFDKDTALDHVYNYRAMRIVKVSLAGHDLEISGLASANITLDARDVFPPAVPRGLVTVASPDEHAIDLSWEPNTENDLGGYIVYRREAGSATAAVRISPAQPVPGPAFHDDTVKPGTRYAYSVSAVDQDGNNSALSKEAEDTLPGTTGPN